MDRPRLGFIGAGVVGTALARLLSDAGYTVVALTSRSADRRATLAERIPEARAVSTPQEVADVADLVFLTVTDDAIEALAASIAWPSGRAAVHCSGVASRDLLEPAKAAGGHIGVFHPLQTFANADQAERNMPGSAFGIEASSDELLGILREMASSLGGTPLVVSSEKAIYHASAVIASNYLVTLLDIAASLWVSLGSTREEGLRALLPLVRGTVENLESVGLPNALTGPIARGDLGTIEQHLAALRRVAADTVPVYKELARRTIPIGRAKGGLTEKAAHKLAAILDRPSEGGRSCE